MTEEQYYLLNRFFVRTFNSILALEDKALADMGIENVSVKESHVIETVIELERCNLNNMTNIAAGLNITVGALSTAVQTLINKGYLRRYNDPKDRRLVLIKATCLGHEVNRIHENFHEEMIAHVAHQLNPEDLERLTQSLEQLSLFFESISNKKNKTED